MSPNLRTKKKKNSGRGGSLRHASVVALSRQHWIPEPAVLCATKQRVDACGLMPAVVTCAGQHSILESCTGKQTCKHNCGYENLPVTYKSRASVPAECDRWKHLRAPSRVGHLVAGAAWSDRISTPGCTSVADVDGGGKSGLSSHECGQKHLP